MQQIKWFERKFVFSATQNIFPSIIERLEGTPLRLADKMRCIPAAYLRQQVAGGWSMQEQVGHLIDLEPLWQGRLADILNGVAVMRSADLTNQKTHEAQHNQKEIQDLLITFNQVRETTLAQLRRLTEADVYKSAEHPRLKKPMRMMDLFLFVAEHDDHHLAQITALHRHLASS